MKKVPSLFLRDESQRFVTRAVHPDCEWVMRGEGRATRKWDGTCVLIRRDGLIVHAFARRMVKDGKPAPPGYIALEHDPRTERTFGWEPMAQSGWAKFFNEACTGVEAPGTYELCGPRIATNAEGLTEHLLIPHGATDLEAPLDFDDLNAYLQEHAPMEGIVWHHPDGRMAKIKRRDFPPSEGAP